jgi:xanthine dehydrogenase YagS FAD-binding subunit
MLPAFEYVRPDTLKDAIKHLAAPGAVVHAGGTDLMGCLRDHIFQAGRVVSLSRLTALHGIKKTSEGGLDIGALTTITDVAESPEINKMYPGLAKAASEVASPQLRNQGTIGGNLCQKPRCWYYRGDFHCLKKGGSNCFAQAGENQFHCILGGSNCLFVHPSDTAPALAALDAVVHVAGPEGKRDVKVDSFFVLPEDDPTKETVLKPGEVVMGVTLPPPPEGLKSRYRKVRARRSWDFALAGAALALVFDGPTVKQARVFLSGAAPMPWRSPEVEDVITGKSLDDSTIAKAAEAVVSNAEPLDKNGYKIPLFKGVIQEELQAMV